MTILKAVSEGLDIKHVNEKREIRNNFDARKADSELKVCPSCKVVWEVMTYNQTTEYKYYHNFPRFGKSRLICPSCTIRMKNKYYYNQEVLDPQ